MSEVWVAAAVGIVGSVVAGKGQEKKDKSDKAHQVAMTKEESALAAQRSGYEMALEEFYTQRDRQRKQRGLDQYRQFSTIQEYNPAYAADSEPRVDPGEAPDYNSFRPADPEAQSAAQGKNKKDFFDKRVDMHYRPVKALKKLF